MATNEENLTAEVAENAEEMGSSSCSHRLRGHLIRLKAGEWVYCDTGEPTVRNRRTCGHCGKADTPEGHDGCLGTLRNVLNACCGHGSEKEAYVHFEDGQVLRGKSAVNLFRHNADEYIGVPVPNEIPPPAPPCKNHSSLADTGCDDEFELIDKLATLLGIAAPESQEERNASALYRRRVLRGSKDYIEGSFKS